MQPMKIKRPWPKDPFVRELQEIVEFREWSIRMHMVDDKLAGQLNHLALLKYLWALREFIYRIIGLNFHADDSDQKLLEIRNFLKSIDIEDIEEPITCNCGNPLIENLPSILIDKNFISYQEGKSGNTFSITKNGMTLFFLLEECLYLAGETSATNLIAERFNPPRGSRSSNSPTFGIMITGWDIQE
jgi:hypothetical protein